MHLKLQLAKLNIHSVCITAGAGLAERCNRDVLGTRNRSTWHWAIAGFSPEASKLLSEPSTRQEGGLLTL
jgi:hypothetical protein